MNKKVHQNCEVFIVKNPIVQSEFNFDVRCKIYSFLKVLKEILHVDDMIYFVQYFSLRMNLLFRVCMEQSKNLQNTQFSAINL
jgi:hypothetical protein